MVDLREVDLARLSLGDKRTLCHQYRKAGLIPPTYNCDTTDDKNLYRALDVPVTYNNALIQAERTKRTTKIQRTRTSPNISHVTADILFVIGQYVDYDVLLGLVAAYPVESLVRELYNPMSALWDGRLFHLTGRGCLKDPKNQSKRALSAPWSIKAQHDAALPRSGYVIVGALERRGRVTDHQPRYERIMVRTNRRVKSLLNHTPQRESIRSGEHEIYQLLALWCDGTVRYFRQAINTLSDGSTNVHALTKAIEDDSYWNVVMAAPHVPITDPKRTLPPTLLPRIRTMVPIRDYILCLDYEGALWYGHYKGLQHLYHYDPLLMTLARITPERPRRSTRSELPSIGPIVHFTIVEGELLEGGASRIMAIVMDEDGVESLLVINGHAMVATSERRMGTPHHMPIYYPLGESWMLAYNGERGDGYLHTLTALDVPGSILPHHAVSVYPTPKPTPYILLAEPAASGMRPYRYDAADKAGRTIQVNRDDYSADLVAAPVGYGGIVNPTPYGGNAPTPDDRLDLKQHLSNPKFGPIRATNEYVPPFSLGILGTLTSPSPQLDPSELGSISANYASIRVYPHWDLGRLPYLANLDGRDKLLLSRQYTFIQARCTSMLQPRNPEKLALLAPDGSVTLVSKVADQRAVVTLQARSVDLTKVRGGSVVAMIQVASAYSDEVVAETIDTMMESARTYTATRAPIISGAMVFGVGV